MNRLTLAFAAASALITAPALAADLPVKAPPPYIPPVTWSGFYIGVQGGGGFGTLDRHLVAPVGTLATFSHAARRLAGLRVRHSFARAVALPRRNRQPATCNRQFPFPLVAYAGRAP